MWYRDSSETNGAWFDTDLDGLPDGKMTVSGRTIGEDMNLNGVRDQDADGNWTETDPLANDSDVDGLLDSWEVNGSWCYATVPTCTPGGGYQSAKVLLALNPDTDGDGLRDGQETAGWQVLTWREITMDEIDNYPVAPDPLDTDSDDDLNSDFIEFQNGSDPWKEDTDGDLWSDHGESISGHNVTGFFMLAPIFIPITFGAPPFSFSEEWLVGKECRGGIGGTFGCTPYAMVYFQVWSWWGVGEWEVNYGKPELSAEEIAEIWNLTGQAPKSAQLLCDIDDKEHKLISRQKCDRVDEIIGNARVYGQTVHGNGGGQNVVNVSVEFQMTTAEDHWDGPFLQARVFDIYGAGTQKTTKLKSTLEKIADFLMAILNAIAEAISLLIKLIVKAIEWVLSPIVKAINDAVTSFFKALLTPFLFVAIHSINNETIPEPLFAQMTRATDNLNMFALVIATILLAFAILTAPLSFFLGSIVSLISSFILSIVISAIIGRLVTEIFDQDSWPVDEDSTVNWIDDHANPARQTKGHGLFAFFWSVELIFLGVVLKSWLLDGMIKESKTGVSGAHPLFPTIRAVLISLVLAFASFAVGVILDILIEQAIAAGKQVSNWELAKDVASGGLMLASLFLALRGAASLYIGKSKWKKGTTYENSFIVSKLAGLSDVQKGYIVFSFFPYSGVKPMMDALWAFATINLGIVLAGALVTTYEIYDRWF